jgi:hypothetical protein
MALVLAEILMLEMGLEWRWELEWVLKRTMMLEMGSMLE